MKICQKCKKEYKYVERRVVGRKIYVYNVHIEQGKKRRCLVEKKTRVEALETELEAILKEVRDRETFLRIVRIILRFLSSAT